ncbi:hypothetical protein BE17_19080 [Sorangium cellulosum]|uniref:Uncharacterized protein n=1 Tax=Sorangium cellulosum TaxID=56 RepID=A0A150RYF9_SORCE|nr:hypothetical protein BE17_19080 [Sorangium cellulosum]
MAPFTALPEHSAPETPQSSPIVQVLTQAIRPPTGRQSLPGGDPAVAQSAVVLHCGATQIPSLHVQLLGYVSLGQSGVPVGQQSAGTSQLLAQ